MPPQTHAPSRTDPSPQAGSATPSSPSSPTSPDSPEDSRAHSAAYPAGSSAAVEPSPPERGSLFSGLSAAQIAGGALAAATAAALGAKLGVAGTVLGAGFASLIINVGGKLYSETLQRTHHGISGVMTRQKEAGSRSVERTVEPKTGGQPKANYASSVADERDASRGSGTLIGAKRPGGRRRWTIIAISTLASFVIAAVVVTMVEAATGRGLDGSPTTTIGRVAGHDAPQQKKSGGDEPSIAPTDKDQRRSDDAEPSQPAAQPSEIQPSEIQPSSQPSAPVAPDETRPDAQPSGNPAPDAQPEPEQAPAAPADPPAAQPKTQNEKPTTSE